MEKAKLDKKKRERFLKDIEQSKVKIKEEEAKEDEIDGVEVGQGLVCESCTILYPTFSPILSPTLSLISSTTFYPSLSITNPLPPSSPGDPDELGAAAGVHPESRESGEKIPRGQLRCQREVPEGTRQVESGIVRYQE